MYILVPISRDQQEISPTCLYRSLATQRSMEEQVSSPGKNWGYSLSKFNPSASTSSHPSKCRIWLRTVCVATGRYWWFTWTIVVGIGVLYVWFTVGGLRSPSNRVPLWVIRARQVANLTVTRGVGQSLLVFSRRAEVLWLCANVYYVNCPANYQKSI